MISKESAKALMDHISAYKLRSQGGRCHYTHTAFNSVHKLTHAQNENVNYVCIMV